MPKQANANWCNKPTQSQFQINFNTENFDALKTLRIKGTCKLRNGKKRKETKRNGKKKKTKRKQGEK